MSNKITEKNITKEMSTSFLDYAMSVIVSRALPDVRDGLKPVHRRILYAMNDLGNYSDKPYKKSARIVGDVIGKYHPHGDTAVYEAMVRMAQDFSFREPLVDGHGNFGSIDGDGAAAMRYTEARMAKLSMELIRDISKNTVNFRENYDGSENEPVVLPAKFPNMLVNGASGIAVGMATNIPPHNLREVCNAVMALIENPEIEIDELMTHIPGPDFPLGASILGSHGIRKAYTTGNGTIKVRSKYQIFEEKNGKSTIIISEIPYQVNKANMVEKIAELVRDKRAEGITDLRDESDRDGIRVVIELKKGITPEVVVNNLFKYTQLESNFSVNMLGLVNNEPKVLNLKEMLYHYLEHQREVIRRRTEFDLNKAQDRIHLLNGLKIAVDNIDKVLKIIRGSKTTSDANENLIKEFAFTEIQTKAILEMRLQKLTGLEIEKLQLEIDELLALISELKAILGDQSKVDEIITEQLENISQKYGNDRRTEIIEGYIDSSIDYEELIEESETLVLLTENGYIKRMNPEEYRTQNRGGKGLKGMKMNTEDELKSFTYCSTHSDLLFFTKEGRVYKIRTHRVPESSRISKGIPIINLIDIEENEQVTNIISQKEYNDDVSFLFVTSNGIAKKTQISEYERVNKNGKKAITLRENDYLVTIIPADESKNLLIASVNGKAIYTEISKYRNLSRVATGVKAISLKPEDYVVGALTSDENDFVLTVTEKGFGKISTISEYRIQNRGGGGVKNININESTGNVVDVKILSQESYDNDDLILISKQGQSIRIKVNNLRLTGRTTKGVKLFKMPEDDQLSVIEIIEGDKEIE